MKLTHVRLPVGDLGAGQRLDTDSLGLPTTWADDGGYAEVAARIALVTGSYQDIEWVRQ